MYIKCRKRFAEQAAARNSAAVAKLVHAAPLASRNLSLAAIGEGNSPWTTQFRVTFDRRFHPRRDGAAERSEGKRKAGG